MSELPEPSVQDAPVESPGSTTAEEWVLHHMRRILMSEAFRGARHSHELLETAIQACLHGKAAELKEHKLAAKFFPTQGAFSSRSFIKMRSVLKRMRGRLRAYYRFEGNEDRMIIEFHRGVYVPNIYWRDSLKPVLDNLPPQGELADTESLPPPPRFVESLEPSPERSASRRAHSSRSRSKSSSRRSSRERSDGPTWFDAKKKAIAAAFLVVPVLAGLVTLVSDKLGITAMPPYGSAQKLTAESELALDPSLSLDGNLLVYASDRDTKGNLNVWLRDLKSKNGESRRISPSEFDDSQPSISPDGSWIAFRSQRDGGGIFLASTRNGEVKKLVSGGRGPRFSPDGKRIAFWDVNQQVSHVESRMFVVSLEGGMPIQLAKDFSNAEFPVWSPDGRYVVFVGRAAPPVATRPDDDAPQPLDWWVMSMESANMIKTGAVPIGIAELVLGPPNAWTKFGNRIVTEGFQSGQRSLRAVTLDGSFKLEGTPAKIEAESSGDAQPSVGGRRIAATSVKLETRIGLLDLDPGTGVASGELKLLGVSGAGGEFAPSLHAGGDKIAFDAERFGAYNAYVRELNTGKETRISNAPRGWTPLYSRDGRLLATLFPATSAQTKAQFTNGVIEVRYPDGSAKQFPCDRCERLLAVANDGSQILYSARNPNNPLWVGLLDTTTRKHSTLLGYPNVILSADWSPSRQFIVFSSRMPAGGIRLMMSRLEGDKASEPTALTEGKYFDDKPRFSADGRIVYFLSNRDNFLCIYGLHVTPTGQSVGDIFPVRHFHQRRLSLDSVPPVRQDISVTANRIALTLQSTQGAITLAETK